MKSFAELSVAIITEQARTFPQAHSSPRKTKPSVWSQSRCLEQRGRTLSRRAPNSYRTTEENATGADSRVSSARHQRAGLLTVRIHVS